MITDPHSILFWLSLLPSVIFFGYLIKRYVVAICDRPKIARHDIVYQEYFASGASQRNMFTKMGGGRNCVRLVVTHDLLWVTSWFPFSIFAAFYDMVHVIPLRNIVSVEVKPARLFHPECYLLTYTSSAGDNRTLLLLPKNPELFFKAIRFPPGIRQHTKA